MKELFVTAAVIKKDGKILIARRAPEKNLGGKWEFPGGKIEEGETHEECLQRELREEFGIESRVGSKIAENKCTYPDRIVNLYAYWVEYVSGDFSLVDHDQIEWVLHSELSNYDLAEADKPFLKNICN